MQRLTTTPYRSGHILATATVILLGANLAVSAVTALITFAQIMSGAASRVPSEDDPITALDLIELGVVLVYMLVFFAAVVVFCMWLYRASKNLPALGNPRQSQQYSPGWGVGSFFVPFANLIIPFRAVREVWAKSDPDAPADNYLAPAEYSAPGSMKVWWAFWLISNFVNNAAFRVYMRADSPGEYSSAAALDLAGDLLTIPSAAFAIIVVREIDRRQEERSRSVVYHPNLPPPPPVFQQPQQQPGQQQPQQPQQQYPQQQQGPQY